MTEAYRDTKPGPDLDAIAEDARDTILIVWDKRQIVPDPSDREMDEMVETWIMTADQVGGMKAAEIAVKECVDMRNETL